MIATLLTAAGAARQKPATDLGNSAFEGYIELLRQQASIPALSGVLIQDRVIAWERGLGFANLESRDCRALGYAVRDRRPDGSVHLGAAAAVR